MVAQAQFSVTEVRVRPGETETLTLTLYNLGAKTEDYTLVPSGLSAGWVHLSPPTVTLFSGSNAAITVTVRPPAMSTTPAGPHPLAVRIIPQNEPDDLLVAETTAFVEAFHDRRVQLLQPVRRSRRRATFEFLIENHGNAHASCRLQLIDLSKRLDGRFNPPAVGIEPGSNSLVQLRVKAIKRQWRRGSRTLPFGIEASQQGFASAEAQATLVQTPMIAESLGRKAVGALAVAGAATASWLWLLKPAAENAAKEAVKNGVAPVVSVPSAPTVAGQVTVPVPVATIAATGSTTVPASNPGASPGALFSHRFTAPVEAGQTRSDTYPVPSGQVLEITDVMLQNNDLDTGTARLVVNGEPLIRWQLESSTGNESSAFVSGLRFVAGDSVVFEVACTTIGDPSSGTCTTALLVSGRTTPAG